MTTYRGVNVQFQYGAETAYATGGTANTAIAGKVVSFSPSINNNIVRGQGLGEGRNVTYQAYGGFDMTFSVEYEVADLTFLQFFVGGIQGAGTTASPYELVERESLDYTDGIKSFKIETAGVESGTNDVDVYSGCMGTSWTLTAAVDSAVKVSCEMAGKTLTSSTSATAFTANSVTPFMFYQGQFKWNGLTVGKVTNVTITQNNSNLIYRALGDRFIQQPEPGTRKYEFSITAKMTETIATTLRDDLYGQANSPTTGVADASAIERELVLELEEGSASGDRRMHIELSGAVLNDMSKPVSVGDDIVEVTLNGFAKHGKTDGTDNVVVRFWTVS